MAALRSFQTVLGGVIGAVIGGVCGGIVAFLAIFIYYRYRKRPREDFDGNFQVDPNPVIPHAEAANRGRDVEFSPYPAGPSSPTFRGSGSMRQYGDSQAHVGVSRHDRLRAPTPTSGSHYASTSSNSTSVHPTSSGQGRTGSLGSSGVSQPSRPLLSREREQLSQHADGPGFASASDGRTGSLGSSRVSQPPHPLSINEREPLHQPEHRDGPGLATPSDGGDEVIQHSDGGRVIGPVPLTQPWELPPSYDSIPVDHS